jgi:hypothetical protein
MYEKCIIMYVSMDGWFAAAMMDMRMREQKDRGGGGIR